LWKIISINFPRHITHSVTCRQYFECDYAHRSIVKRTHTHTHRMGQVISYLLGIALLKILLSKRGNSKI